MICCYSPHVNRPPCKVTLLCASAHEPNKECYLSACISSPSQESLWLRRPWDLSVSIAQLPPSRGSPSWLLIWGRALTWMQKPFGSTANWIRAATRVFLKGTEQSERRRSERGRQRFVFTLINGVWKTVDLWKCQRLSSDQLCEDSAPG